MTSPAPLSLAEFLSPAWLSGALAPLSAGAEVTSVEVTETLKTVATKVRFAVQWSGPDVADRPSAFCVKGYFDPAEGDRSGAGLVETSFYRDLASHLPLRTPPCVYTGLDDATGHGVVLIRDLVADGCTFLTALSPYSPDQAAATLDQLARLHAYPWSGTPAADAEWLAPRTASLADHMPLARLQQLLDDPRSEHLPASITDAERVVASLRALVARKADDPMCLIHGDTHAGNLYVTPSGEPGVIDWQLVQRGHWALDVAYHLGAVLSVEDRERSERDLLAHYLDRRVAHGGDAVSFDEAWDDYRQSLAWGYFLWAITQRVDPPIIYEFMKRLGTAVATHGTFEALGV